MANLLISVSLSTLKESNKKRAIQLIGVLNHLQREPAEAHNVLQASNIPKEISLLLCNRKSRQGAKKRFLACLDEIDKDLDDHHGGQAVSVKTESSGPYQTHQQLNRRKRKIDELGGAAVDDGRESEEEKRFIEHMKGVEKGYMSETVVIQLTIYQEVLRVFADHLISVGA